MRLYVGLVEDMEVKNSILPSLIDEWQRTQKMLEGLLGKPISKRRKNHYYSTILRAEALEYLHRSQVELLRTWRKQKKLNYHHEAEKTQMKLLQCINAIANAMGNTG